MKRPWPGGLRFVAGCGVLCSGFVVVVAIVGKKVEEEGRRW